MDKQASRSHGFGIYFAYPLALMWSAYWVWLGTSVALGEREGALGLLAHILMPAPICFVLTVLPVWSEGIGGVALVASGVLLGLLSPVLFAGQEPYVMAVLGLTSALPPILAGGLFLADARRMAQNS